MSYLGIDLGTSGLRALLVDTAGTPIGSAEHSYPTAQPHFGWSEQNPQDWIAAVEHAIADLRKRHPDFANLKGIGVAGHMHGATLLDANNNVLRPCIMWNDTRSHVEAGAMDANPMFRKISGNIVFPGFTAPKLDWVRTHEPDIFGRIAKVLLPAAFINHYLTGDYFSDMSDAAGTAWFDVTKRAWSPDLLSACGMRLDQMPRLTEGSVSAGCLRSDLTAQWGLKSNPAIAGGAGDNATSACGMGILNDGDGFVSLGTSGVLLLARDDCRPAPATAVHTFCHAIPGKWIQMGVMLSAADCMTWFSNITGQSPAELTTALGTDIRLPSAVNFQPYLSGERTPHNDASLRAGFTGISRSTTREDMTHAVLQGVCFGLRDSFEAISATGGQLKRLYVLGGGSVSRYWVTLLAIILNTPIHLPKGGEFGAALGAARLAQTAATGETAEAAMPAAATAEVIAPQAHLVPAYDRDYKNVSANYSLYKSLSDREML